MLILSIVIVSVILWAAVYIFYFWRPIYAWFDNRFGPKHVVPKPPKPPRRRMYD